MYSNQFTIVAGNCFTNIYRQQCCIRLSIQCFIKLPANINCIFYSGTISFFIYVRSFKHVRYKVTCVPKTVYCFIQNYTSTSARYECRKMSSHNHRNMNNWMMSPTFCDFVCGNILSLPFMGCIMLIQKSSKIWLSSLTGLPRIKKILTFLRKRANNSIIHRCSTKTDYRVNDDRFNHSIHAGYSR